MTSQVLKTTPRLTKAMAQMTFNQTMLRVKSPQPSIAFYQNYFDMQLAQELHFSDFSLYFMVSLPEGQVAPTPGTDEAIAFMKSGDYGCCLELTHNHGTETQEGQVYHNGNVNPLGFGHVGFLVDDSKKVLEKLVKDGYSQVETLNPEKEVFVADPDGYYVKIEESNTLKTQQTSFHHAMIRVKDAELSLQFYRDLCGMTLIDILDRESKISYFVGTLDDAQKGNLPEIGTTQAHDFVKNFRGQLLELRHTKGVENDPTCRYHNGNTDPQGFGHLAIMVNDVYEVSEALEEAGADFKKRPNEGRMKGLAFVLDPDGYWVEIIARRADIPDAN